MQEGNNINIRKALLAVSIALDDAIVNRQPTERLEEAREAILNVISNEPQEELS